MGIKQRLKFRKTMYDKKVFSQDVERHKLPNFPIVKFIFENDVLDMLVFLVLRFYSEIKKVENEDEDIIDFVDYIGHTSNQTQTLDPFSKTKNTLFFSED